MPEWKKISHVSFSVRDADASARWLVDLLDMTELERVGGDAWSGVVLEHRPSGTVLEFQQHADHDGSRFDHRRTGLDHIGLQVATRAELDAWQRELEQKGVDHTPVVDREYGAVLTFRHPDGIQFEFFHRQDHP